METDELTKNLPQGMRDRAEDLIREVRKIAEDLQARSKAMQAEFESRTREMQSEWQARTEELLNRGKSFQTDLPKKPSDIPGWYRDTATQLWEAADSRRLVTKGELDELTARVEQAEAAARAAEAALAAQIPATTPQI